MTPPEVLDLACEGAMLAVVLRSVFRLDVGLHWAAGVGALSFVLQSWLSAHVGAFGAVHSLPDLVTGAAVTTAFLGIAQVIGN